MQYLLEGRFYRSCARIAVSKADTAAITAIHAHDLHSRYDGWIDGWTNHGAVITAKFPPTFELEDSQVQEHPACFSVTTS